MADGAVVDAAVEFLFVHAGAGLALELDAAGARVDHPRDPHAIDAAADRAERGRQPIHDEARIHAGSEQRQLPLLGQLVEPLGDLRMPQPRVGQFLARRNDRKSGGERLRQLAFDVVEPAAGGVQHDAALRFFHFGSRIGSDDHVRSGRIEHVGELFTDPRRVEIDGGHDFQFRFLERAASNAAADGPKAHQCDFDRHSALIARPPEGLQGKAGSLPGERPLR